MATPSRAGRTTVIDARRSAGKAARETLSRKAQGVFALPERDPVAVIEAQNTTRVQTLVPIRVGRMLESPFALYRGSAAMMAHDLADSPVTGCQVVASGDAHLANFGLFASPERRMLFDLNDFDEAYPAPWEWDVRRLAASVWIHGRANSYTEAQCADATGAAVRSYRNTLSALFQLTATERYYFQEETDVLEHDPRAQKQRIRAIAEKARKRTSEQVLRKLTTMEEDGKPYIVDQFPVIRHSTKYDLGRITELYHLYLDTLRADIRLLLTQYEVVDYAMRIVGVGSVGTRCWLLLLQGPAGEPLFLQAKEAPRSVLETHGKVAAAPDSIIRAVAENGQGSRVVGAQRILQAQSDPFLGWVRDVEGDDGLRRDFYLRQFRDMKGSVDLQTLVPAQSARYAALCGTMLARAHSQSPGSAFIAGYLGNGETFDLAITAWARLYADQSEKDHEALRAAVKAGRLPAETGL
ncbi:DUF2252 domain-containing protein [Rhodococcus opacus]|uniref:DUF2252 domain-containing protein n=1 Tax=Rhodococcus opacus TaxID=37919 RepID=UPI001C492880|nr:DUF2252 domain-containing protein [Rhodococcus opacus]MBV6762059.1 DUF2252 domain-containing protein [Rhodococcus opacus]